MTQIHEYTDPSVFTDGISEGWADTETDPTRIDWSARQAVALLPYTISAEGRPVSPAAGLAPVARGRNGLGRWGENPMADALVMLTDAAGVRRVLLIERKDGTGWAVPGGSIEAGESPVEASIRELAEEAGLDLAGAAWLKEPARWVPDPRGSDEAWAVTCVAWVDLGTVAELPELHPATDAKRAAWVVTTGPDGAGSLAALEADLSERFGGVIFPAHVQILTEFVDA